MLQRQPRFYVNSLWFRLQPADIDSLKTFGSIDHFKLNSLPLFQSLEAIHVQIGVVNKNILALGI